ncbi:class I SAM-dependent methyltransferase [Pseudonocardia spinosispora]|uniref:class I SAM-dependent methyltransferase n=1 Tax=Pseudonocardia spinosispora TaxID=103441 RepID=UPI00041F1C72|nr:class I SAM-dependent methyltransferase [Pseudonocardia spinosispora]
MGVREVLRAKLTRAIDEVVARHRSEQTAELRRELEQLKADVRAESDRVIDFVRSVEIRDRRDMFAAEERRAVVESADFVRTSMPSARPFPNPTATLEHGLSLVSGDGMALEFGVYNGSTLKIIAAGCGDRPVYGFDSFEGLPEDWRPGFPAGAFTAGGIPSVPGASMVVGWFSDTLPGFLASHPGPVAFLHIDADLYSSTRTVLDLVGPRLRVGSVIVFDEYFNYPGWADHEHRAWCEHVSRTGLRFTYEAYTLDNEQVVVQVTSLVSDEAVYPEGAPKV